METAATTYRDVALVIAQNVIVDAQIQQPGALGVESSALAHDKHLTILADPPDERAARRPAHRIETRRTVDAMPFRAVVLARRVKPRPLRAQADKIALVYLHPHALPITVGVDARLYQVVVT